MIIKYTTAAQDIFIKNKNSFLLLLLLLFDIHYIFIILIVGRRRKKEKERKREEACISNKRKKKGRRKRKKKKKRRKKKLELKTRRGESTRAHTQRRYYKETTGFSARQSDNIVYNVVQSLGAHHHTRIDSLYCVMPIIWRNKICNMLVLVLGLALSNEYFIFLPTNQQHGRRETNEWWFYINYDLDGQCFTMVDLPLLLLLFYIGRKYAIS